MVRKHAIISIGQYLDAFPTDPEATQIWTRSILGTVVDVEATVVERALDEMEVFLFRPLVRFSKRPRMKQVPSKPSLNTSDDEADEAAADVLDAIEKERFLVTPHAEVLEYVSRKGNDRDRWITGMQRLQERFEDWKPGDS